MVGYCREKVCWLELFVCPVCPVRRERAGAQNRGTRAALSRRQVSHNILPHHLIRCWAGTNGKRRISVEYKYTRNRLNEEILQNIIFC